MRRINWDTVEENVDFPKPKPGGYIARIIRVEDNEDREYLQIEWDFAQKPLAGYNRSIYEKFDRWPYILRRSYKESALGFFKAFKTALENSNPNYHFSEDRIHDMEGKYIGVILGMEEYNGKLSLKVRETRSIAVIQRGEYEVPTPKLEKRPVDSSAVNPFTDLGDEEEGEDHLPF
jgi:hypothetical protein